MGLLGKDLIQKYSMELASTRVGTEGSEHSAFLEKIIGKTGATPSLHNQMFQELLGKDLIQKYDLYWI